MADLRVLVVDDEPQVAAGHAEYVRRIPGFTVTAVVGTARDALRALQREPADLVLLDLNLPGEHGLEFARAVRAAGGCVDILAVTAARETHLVRSAVSLGVVGYLLKPFTFADLRERLAAYRRYRGELAEAATTSQSSVDAALRELRPARYGDRAAPKGLATEVLERVIDELRATGPQGVTASQLAAAIGSSRVTARRYLQYLADQGRAVRRQRPAETGRPEIVFAWRD